MTALGILGLDGGLVSRAVHPHRRWIDGWNFDPATHHVRAVGDLDGDGRSTAIVTSDWGMGLIEHDGGAFRCPFAVPRDARLGSWRHDPTTLPGRDRMPAIASFTGSARQELLVCNAGGMAVLERTSTGLAPTRHYADGRRLGGWVLNAAEDRCAGSGRFAGDDASEMLLTSPRGWGLVSARTNASLAVVPMNGLVGSWALRAGSVVHLIADLDGDGRDEILAGGPGGIAVLKWTGERLATAATRGVGESLDGHALATTAKILFADRFRGGSACDILVADHRGLHVLVLDGGRLRRRAFAEQGSRVDGWLVDGIHNVLLAAGDLSGDGTTGILVRSEWGLGVMSIGADDRFRCLCGHPYGTRLGDWPLESSDVIAGAAPFTAGGRTELLVKKPWAGAVEPAFAAAEFVNWHGNVRRTVNKARPSNLAELVAVVRAAPSHGSVTGIAGSGWSFTDCVAGSRTQVLIDTSALKATLGGLLPDLVDDRIDASGGRFVHVEAGIPLHELNCRLNALGLALPTLGASRGQSLAGVLGTGVHGSDVSLPPIADAVRAMHLVGPDGQQWWIEPATQPLTTREALNAARARGVLDPSVRNVYDDEWFNAALVAMGCAGVVYAVVLACRPAFQLRSITFGESWTAAQRRIGELEFRRSRPRFLEINVNPADRSCRVTLRNETTAPPSPPSGVGGGPPTAAIVAAAGLIGPGALGLFTAAIGDYVARTTAEVAALHLIPFAGPGLAAEKTAQALKPVEDAHRLLVELNLAGVDASNPQRVADILPTAINLVWVIGAFVVQGRQIVDGLQQALTLQERPDRDVIGRSFRIFTAQPDCSADGSQSHDAITRLVESHEYAVPAERAIAFVDRLLGAVDEVRRGSDAIVVNLNLRFTARTRATLGMQKFDTTCHVEIYTFRGLRGNDAFRQRLHAIVREFGALPHWGQLHRAEEAREFAEIRALERWQRPMRALAGGNPMFWSAFAVDRGLLP